jgi:ABC-type sugar transport system ATPase subunit
MLDQGETRRTIVVAEDLTRRYGAVEALSGVSFTIREREIVGFAGDNGAGKSTVMKIVSGAERPTSGVVYVLEEKVTDFSPMRLREQGVEMVYQDLALCENLSLPENVFLGRLLPRRGWRGKIGRQIDRREMAQQSEGILERLAVEVAETNEVVGRLSGGQKQAVAIARVVAFSPRLVILDEPTAALSVNAIEPVLELVRRLPSQGAAVMIVSHRLTDLLTTTDRIYVLRSGRTIGEFETAKTSESELLHAMAGLGR